VSNEPWLVAIAVGCAEAPAPTTQEDEVPSLGVDAPLRAGLELGTGVLSFESAADGDEMVMVFGQQGGYHLPLAIRSCGTDGESAHSQIEGVVASTADVVVDVTLDHGWVPDAQGCRIALDVKGFLFHDEPDWAAPQLDGEFVDLHLVSDDGTEARSDDLQVLVDAP
jgi:hypothetical protein